MNASKATKKNEKPEKAVKPERAVRPWEVGDVDENTRRVVWSGLGRKSVRELSEETGLAPEQVHAVRRALFEEIDVLTVDEQITKALVSMQELADHALEKSKTIQEERNLAGLLNASVNAQEKILKQLRAMRKEDTSKVDALNALRVRELLALMDRVVQSGVKELAEEHGLDEADTLQVFTNRLVSEALALDGEAK